MGSALINQMLSRIDEDALPAFLDMSAPDKLGYYERYPAVGHEEAAVSGSGGMSPRTRRSASGTQEGQFGRGLAQAPAPVSPSLLRPSFVRGVVASALGSTAIPRCRRPPLAGLVKLEGEKGGGPT